MLNRYQHNLAAHFMALRRKHGRVTQFMYKLYRMDCFTNGMRPQTRAVLEEMTAHVR